MEVAAVLLRRLNRRCIRFSLISTLFQSDAGSYYDSYHRIVQKCIIHYHNLYIDHNHYI
jgi:hypothetical protein